jgi:2-haloacid dehalogenase
MDCYGTLIDWKKGIEENFAKYFFQSDQTNVPEIFQKYVTLEAARERSNYKSYREILGQTSLDLAQRLGLECSAEASTLFSDSIENWTAFPDTQPALKQLGKLSMRRYILSNVDNTILKKTISNNGLEIDGIVTAEEIKSYKPSKRHWAEFQKRTRARVKEIIHVANSIYHDIIPARQLGILTVWVNRYAEHRPLLARPDYTVDSLSEIPDLLKRNDLV